MPNPLTDYTVVRKSRLQELRGREKAWFDLNFLRAMPADHRSACLELLDLSPAQLRQDLLALIYNGFRKGGYFVEFGATNGKHLSNTWLLESQFGWNGILAEPAHMYQAELQANRNCTIDNRCVWTRSGETLNFTQAPRGGKSTISSFAKANYAWRGETYDVETVSLNDLLEEHGAPETIDFISLDTEGSELDILKAFDFDRWRFRVLAVEHNTLPARSDILALLTSNGYRRIHEDVSRFDDWYLGPE